MPLNKTRIEDATISYEFDDDTKDQVYTAIVNWCFENRIFTGEEVMQEDYAQEQAPVLLSDILDNIIKFDVTWDEE